MDYPLVSVVIPAYNTGRYIHSILGAILNQTYKNIELLLVDDGSTDDTVEIAKSFLQESSIQWNIVELSNGGVSRARNIGISQAKGEWIMCPDSDDFIAPNTIEYLLSSAVENNAQCAFCEYKEVKEGSIKSPCTYDNGIKILDQEEFKMHNLLRVTCVVIPGMMIHRSVFERIQFDESCPYSEDTLYTWELIYQCHKVVWLKCDLYNYLIREGSKQHSLTKENCLASIARYEIATTRIRNNNPDDKIAQLIQPKFVLASMHVLARCNNYSDFRAVYVQTDKKHIFDLFRLRNFKLSLFGILYKYVPYLFYQVARVR